MSRKDLTSAAVTAIESAWEKGCPVASSAEEIAPIAVRRWLSSGRRGVTAERLDERIEDLTKGLIERFEGGPRPVGCLRADYEYLAHRIAEALSA